MPTVSDTEIIVVSDVPLQSSLDSAVYQVRSEKGQPDGYASLGVDGKVPSAQLPTSAGAVASVNGQIGVVNLTSSDVGAVPTTDKGSPNGVATLDGTGKVPSSQLAISVNDASTTAKGIVQLAGDLGGTAAAPTVPGLAGKEDSANKGVANGYAPLDASSKVPSANLPTSSSNVFVDITAAPYNADKTGTTDSTVALQNAVNDVAAAGGGIVYMPKGRFLLNQTGAGNIKIPFSNTGMVTIRGAGLGATTLQLSAQVLTAFSLTPVTNGTFQNVTLEDFTVDAMNLNASGSGTICQFYGQNFNIDRVIIQRTEAINNGVNPVASGRRGIYLGIARTDLYGQGSNPQNTVTNVIIRNNRIRGGATGIAFFSFCSAGNSFSQNATATKTRADVVYDNCFIEYNDFDSGVVPTAFYVAAGIQVVGDGLGKRIVIRDNRVVNCGDVGIEVDSTLDLTVERNHCESCINEGIYLSPNHGGMPLPHEQIMRVRDNTIIRPGSIITMYGIVSNARDGSQQGHIIFEGNRVIMQGTFAVSPGEALRVEGPHRSITMRDNTVVYDGMAYTATANNWTLFARAIFLAAQGNETRIAVDGLMVEYRGSIDAAGFTGGALQTDVINVAGGATKLHGSIERVIVRNDVTLLNGGTHRLRIVTLNGNANLTETFASDRMAFDYTFTAGTSTDVAVAGGVLTSVANHSTEKRIRWIQTGLQSNLNQIQRIVDAAPFIGFTPGATLTGFKVGHGLKVSDDGTQRLEGYLTDDGTNSYACFDKVVAGTRTSLLGAIVNGAAGTVTAINTPTASQADRGIKLATRLASATAAGVRTQIQGNTLKIDRFTSAAAPSVTTAGSETYTVSLAGNDITTFGSDGQTGWYELLLVPADVAANFDNLRIDRLSVIQLTFSRFRFIQRQPLSDAKFINLGAASTLLRLDGVQRVRDMDFQSMHGAGVTSELTVTDTLHTPSFFIERSTWATPPTATPIAVGASPFTYTNNDPYPEDVPIYAGTVSAVTLTRNGVTQQIAASTGLVPRLQPTDSITVTYSSLPVMAKVPVL